MKYQIEKDSQTPAYMQIYQAVRTDILQGRYHPDEKLPSKRLMALHLGVSVITVAHAYELLVEEGYVDAVERSGYRVSSSEEPIFSSCEETESLLRLTQTMQDYSESFPFSLLSKAMRSVLSQYQEKIYVKADNQGCEILREAIASYLARSRNIIVDQEQIVIGAGAEYLYSVVAILLKKHKKIAIEYPSYSMIEKVYSNCGMRCEKLGMASDGIASSELKNMSANILHVTPYHSYPTGITASISKRIEYLEIIAKKRGVIVEDDYDSEFTALHNMADTLYSLANTESIQSVDVIYINTFSRTIASSMRVGYMVLPKAYLNQYQKCFRGYSCTVPVFEQLVLAKLLNQGEFERHLNRIRRNRRKK